MSQATPLPKSLPLSISIPCDIRFHNKDKKVVASGELLFLDSKMSVVNIKSVADREDIPKELKDMKGVTIPKVGQLLDILYPRLTKAPNHWAERVSIKLGAEWELFKYNNPTGERTNLTKDYLVLHCKNKNQKRQYRHLLSINSSKKPARQHETKKHIEDDSDDSDLDQSYLEPTSKKSKVTEASDSPSTTERRATRNSPTTPDPKPQSSTSSITNDIDKQVRSLVSVIDNQIAEETKKMEEAKVEYHKLRDSVNTLKRRREALDQFYQTK